MAKNNISVATIKNRNAHLRWLCEKLGKTNVVPANNYLRVSRRKYIGTPNKAVELKDVDLSKITNKHIFISVHLQYYLGLRREESLKIKPHQADKGDHIALQDSWCKGGRSRTAPITSAEARYWLDEAKKLVTSNQSLIPENKTYIQHRNLYDKQVKRAGIKHAHGLRHSFAQNHYKELTSWECPKRGGLMSKQLTEQQKEIDRNARLIISTLLGHSRISVTGIYLG